MTDIEEARGVMSLSSEEKNWETKIFSSELSSLICPMSSAVPFRDSTSSWIDTCLFFSAGFGSCEAESITGSVLIIAS